MRGSPTRARNATKRTRRPVQQLGRDPLICAQISSARDSTHLIGPKRLCIQVLDSYEDKVRVQRVSVHQELFTRVLERLDSISLDGCSCPPAPLRPPSGLPPPPLQPPPAHLSLSFR